MTGRKKIYYWKSDRPHAGGNTQVLTEDESQWIEYQLSDYLRQNFYEGPIRLQPAGGQGNHITYFAHCDRGKFFLRLENGPEKDNYMAVESRVMEEVRHLGIPVPTIYITDVTRLKIPFALQIMECIEYKDLNVIDKRGELDTVRVAREIGSFVARWQSVQPAKYGLFIPDIVQSQQQLEGYHDTYEQYFFLNWDTHLDFLCTSGLMDSRSVNEVKDLAVSFRHLLRIDRGCLVHKDLALWNILGDGQHISAFIDWDDAVSGDPVDDLSLLGCFHSGEVVLSAVEGYALEKPLPEDFEQRFWLHLLRNIVFKAVIRVRGDYFNKNDKFFLNNPRSKGLQQFTLERIASACEGLKGNKSISEL